MDNPSRQELNRKCLAFLSTIVEIMKVNRLSPFGIKDLIKAHFFILEQEDLGISDHAIGAMINSTIRISRESTERLNYIMTLVDKCGPYQEYLRRYNE